MFCGCVAGDGPRSDRWAWQQNGLYVSDASCGFMLSALVYGSSALVWPQAMGIFSLYFYLQLTMYAAMLVMAPCLHSSLVWYLLNGLYPWSMRAIFAVDTVHGEVDVKDCIPRGGCLCRGTSRRACRKYSSR